MHCELTASLRVKRTWLTLRRRSERISIRTASTASTLTRASRGQDFVRFANRTWAKRLHRKANSCRDASTNSQFGSATTLDTTDEDAVVQTINQLVLSAAYLDSIPGLPDVRLEGGGWFKQTHQGAVRRVYT